MCLFHECPPTCLVCITQLTPWGINKVNCIIWYGNSSKRKTDLYEFECFFHMSDSSVLTTGRDLSGVENRVSTELLKAVKKKKKKNCLKKKMDKYFQK